MGPTNIALVRLFQADLSLRQAQGRLDAAQKNVRIQERKVKELSTRLSESSARLREQQAEGGRLDLEIKTRDAHIERLREQQMTATNSKIYQTFLVEINTAKVDRGKIEDEALTAMAAIEATQAEVTTLSTQLEMERAKLASFQSEIGQTVEKLQAEVDALRPARDAAASALPGKALTAFERLSEHNEGEAMSAIARPDRRREEYVCSACNMDLVADVYNKLHSRDDLVFCPSCHRILYIPADLPPEMAVKKPRERRDKPAASTGVKPPPPSREAWTESDFLTRVERENSPSMTANQTAVLDALHSSIPGVSAHFNGQGAVNPAYNVYVENVSRPILRVNADGRIFAFYSAFDDAGQPELTGFFRSVMEPFALDASRESEPRNPADPNISQLDANQIIAALKSLGDKAAERRTVIAEQPEVSNA